MFAQDIKVWEQGLRDIVPGVEALQKALINQVPPALVSKSPVPIPTNEQLDPIVKDLIEQVIGIFEGKSTEFVIPRAAIELLPGLALPACTPEDIAAAAAKKAAPKKTTPAKAAPAKAAKATPKKAVPAKGTEPELEERSTTSFRA